MKVKVSYSPTLSEINEVDFTSETTKRGEWIIGRSPDSDLVLDSPDVSRQHGKFFIKSGSYYFSDLGSRNGSIFNGKQAEKERSYLLNDGDIIRIADYVLVVEAVAPTFEQAETVFRIIDPSLFARPRSPENISSPNVVNPTPEVVSQTPIEEISQTPSEAETPVVNAASPEISEIPEVVSTQPEDVIPLADISTSENIIQPVAVISDEVADSATPQVAAEASPDVGEVETPIVGWGINSPVSETSDVSLSQPDDVTPTAEEITAPENIIEADSEESAVAEVTDEISDLEAALAAESTFVQPRDLVTPAHQEESAVAESTDNEFVDWEAAPAAEATFVQPRDIFSREVPGQESSVTETDNQFADLEAALAAESTFVQPRDIFNHEATQEESAVPEATHDEVENSDTSVAAEVNVDVEEQDADIQQEEALNQVAEEDSQVPQDVSNEVLDTSIAAEVNADVEEQDADIQQEEALNQAAEEDSQVPQDVSNEVLDTSLIAEVNADVEEQDANIQMQEPLNQVPEEESQVSQDVTHEVLDTSDAAEVNADVDAAFLEVESSAPSERVIEVIEVSTIHDETAQAQEDVSQVFSNQHIDFSNTSTEQASVDVADVVNIPSLETTESVITELTSPNIEVISQADQPDEISQETNVSEPSPVIIDRNIVLIAHESKKSELAEFVAQHKDFFSRSFTITWPSISEILHQQVGITISRQTPAPTSGGYQTIASSVGSGEILAVIFLRDLLQPQTGQANEEALLRLCTINQVLLATNVSTAEAIVHYIKYITE
ncbi:FHA domain-containing protein [Nostoc sp. UHCC 0302]|uniref:FHA domain-containing protein n=1 Tax=Nostoc sp. UHCC 0302 TaxID=3134896 RepID=UPI00311CC266